MLSIIWVATITGLFNLRERVTICFWYEVTDSKPTSTARSPRATITPSQLLIISSITASDSTTSARSNFAINLVEQPIASNLARASVMSSGFDGKDTHI